MVSNYSQAIWSFAKEFILFTWTFDVLKILFFHIIMMRAFKFCSTEKSETRKSFRNCSYALRWNIYNEAIEFNKIIIWNDNQNKTKQNKMNRLNNAITQKWYFPWMWRSNLKNGKKRNTNEHFQDVDDSEKEWKKTTMVLSDLCVSVCVRVQEIAIKKFLYIV